MKSFRSIRGFAFLVLLPYIAGGGVVLWAAHEYGVLFAPGRNKTVAEQSAAVAAQASSQAATVKLGADEVHAAVAAAAAEHAAVLAKRDAIDQNAAGFIEGARQAIAADPSPSDADQVAATLLDSATAAIGQPLTTEQRAVWSKTVAGLIAKNAVAQARIAQMTSDAAALRASLDATQAHAKASDDHVTTLSGQLATAAKDLTATTAKAADLTAANKAWADKEPDITARIHALLWLLALTAGLLVWYEIKRRGLTGLHQDAVAYSDKAVAAATATGDEATKLKSELAVWWADDPAAKQLYDAAKAKLRL